MNERKWLPVGDDLRDLILLLAGGALGAVGLIALLALMIVGAPE